MTLIDDEEIYDEQQDDTDLPPLELVAVPFIPHNAQPMNVESAQHEGFIPIFQIPDQGPPMVRAIRQMYDRNGALTTIHFLQEQSAGTSSMQVENAQ